MMMPTDEMSHQCNFCHKLFSNLEFENHILTHSGENPTQCIHCGMSFTMSNQLKEHMRTHTGEKSYHCNICKKSFSTSGTLKRHMLTHTGKKCINVQSVKSLSQLMTV